jgi:hypothetical protein
VLAGGAVVVLRSRLLPVEVSWLQGVLASVFIGECATGVVFQMKVSTVGGNSGDSLGEAPSEGTIEDHHVLSTVF